jgi:nuclear protein localization family protein 4
MILRIRTKDGTERLTIDSSATLAALRQQIAAQFGIPVGEQMLCRSVLCGPMPAKGTAFMQSEEPQTLSSLGIGAGEILFLDYQRERENQEKYLDKDPFVTLVKEGELRSQGKAQWTLTNFLDYRSTKEFVIEAPPEPHTKYVCVDPSASQLFINFCLATGFGSKRAGYLYGRWVTSEAGEAGVEVHAIYEPRQQSTADEVVLDPDTAEEERLEKLAGMLGLVRVGVILAHAAREFAFSVNEILLAARMHAEAVAADPEHGKYFVTMKARPVLEAEKEIEGVATMEAYQLTDQAVALCARPDGPAFSQSKSDCRVAKAVKDCCFIIEKKETKKTTMEPFVARIFDIARPFKSPLSCGGFPVANRPTEVQNVGEMGMYLRRRRDRKEHFLSTVSDLHLLLFLGGNLLDMAVDMPVLCAKIVEGKADELEGFQMMINCYGGL